MPDNVSKNKPRITVPYIRAMKGAGCLVALTAYTAPMAKLIDKHVDIILVGDSLGMVVYGMKSTLAVTLDMMIAHGRAVAESAQKACVIVDMPFASYQESPERAFASAARIMAETGAQAVKLEGNSVMAPTVKYLVDRGIPVMAHIGLMPQYANIMGGHKVQGRDDSVAQKIVKDAYAMEEAGAFSIVLEGVVESLAEEITNKITIPIIGIGASAVCDGQILVTEDILGLSVGSHTPKFVKQYIDLGVMIDGAVEKYAAEVRSGNFPAKQNCYGKMVSVNSKAS